MDHVYMDSVKSTNNYKKWLVIDISSRSLLTLKRKEVVAKFRIFSEYNCLAHHLKRMNVIDSDICVLCNQNSIINSEHLLQCSSLNRERQQAKRSLASIGKQDEK